MSNVLEFGFDDAKIIKVAGVEVWKQQRSGHTNRVSVVAFRKFHDVALAIKTREKGAPLDDGEVTELFKKIDGKIAEQLDKKPEDLTEVDRLDLKQPRFWVGMTHWGDGVGTIRCLGEYEGTTLVKPGLCCRKFGDADQKIGTVIIEYPIGEGAQVDGDLLAQHKYTTFGVWVMNAKKFKRVESAYMDARNDDRYVIDLKVTLDGEPKYQKQVIEGGGTAFWARDKTDPEVRQWVLERGLRAHKYVPQNLGFEMSEQKLIEKLGQGGGDGNAQLGQGSADQPKMTSYDNLLNG